MTCRKCCSEGARPFPLANGSSGASLATFKKDIGDGAICISPRAYYMDHPSDRVVRASLVVVVT
jgi:hypothetical protein